MYVEAYLYNYTQEEWVPLVYFGVMALIVIITGIIGIAQVTDPRKKRKTIDCSWLIMAWIFSAVWPVLLPLTIISIAIAEFEKIFNFFFGWPVQIIRNIRRNIHRKRSL